MGSDWNLVELGSLVDINPANRNRDWPYDVIEYIDISAVEEGFISSAPARILVSEAPSRAQRLIKDGDTVISTVRPNRRSMFFAKDPSNKTVVSTGFAVVRPKPGLIHPRFLYALIFDQHFTDYLVSREQGAAYPAISPGDIANAKVQIPSYEEQERIAHVFGTLDDKIELNRRMAATLEEMARALFKSWFVDFDPVRAKAEGRPRGLPPDIDALFPDELVESEVGLIPKGWACSTLGEMVDTVKGRSYKSEELVEADVALVTLKSFARGGGYRPDGLKSFSGTYKAEQIVSPGEVVIACTDVTQAADVIGRTAIVRGTSRFRQLVASLDTLIVRPRDRQITHSFLYLLGRSDAFVSHTYAHTTGTTVLHLAKDAVPTFTFACPVAQLVECFDSLAAPALDRVRVLEEESGVLADLRDSLLPKLISGELSVSEVGL